jgi:DNA polymerase
MMVGEQPGDNEDLAGRPFIGPAGQLFDQLMDRAGLDRSTVFLTNAVKHFKFTLKGRRRIHQSPNGGEISACRWWIAQEIGLVRPKLLVALGASAAETLTGTRKDVLKRRGTVEGGREGIPVFLTVHPSFLLRLPDRDLQAAETERFVEDLVAARGHLQRLMAA